MQDGEKLKAVRDYLETELPGCRIGKPDESRFAEALSYDIEWHSQTFIAVIDNEFLTHHPAAEIPSKLAKFTFAEHLRDLPNTPVIVTRSGLELEAD